jgi:hypothetical protein
MMSSSGTEESSESEDEYSYSNQSALVSKQFEHRAAAIEPAFSAQKTDIRHSAIEKSQQSKFKPLQAQEASASAGSIGRSSEAEPHSAETQEQNDGAEQEEGIEEQDENSKDANANNQHAHSSNGPSGIAAAGFKKFTKKSISIKIKAGNDPQSTGASGSSSLTPPLANASANSANAIVDEKSKLEMQKHRITNKLQSKKLDRNSLAKESSPSTQESSNATSLNNNGSLQATTNQQQEQKASNYAQLTPAEQLRAQYNQYTAQTSQYGLQGQFSNQLIPNQPMGPHGMLNFVAMPPPPPASFAFPPPAATSGIRLLPPGASPMGSLMPRTAGMMIAPGPGSSGLPLSTGLLMSGPPGAAINHLHSGGGQVHPMNPAGLSLGSFHRNMEASYQQPIMGAHLASRVPPSSLAVASYMPMYPVGDGQGLLSHRPINLPANPSLVKQDYDEYASEVNVNDDAAYDIDEEVEEEKLDEDDEYDDEYYDHDQLNVSAAASYPSEKASTNKQKKDTSSSNRLNIDEREYDYDYNYDIDGLEDFDNIIGSRHGASSSGGVAEEMSRGFKRRHHRTTSHRKRAKYGIDDDESIESDFDIGKQVSNVNEQMLLNRDDYENYSSEEIDHEADYNSVKKKRKMKRMLSKSSSSSSSLLLSSSKKHKKVSSKSNRNSSAAQKKINSKNSSKKRSKKDETEESENSEDIQADLEVREDQDLDSIKSMLKNVLEMRLANLEEGETGDQSNEELKLILETLLDQIKSDNGLLSFDELEQIHDKIKNLLDTDL